MSEKQITEKLAVWERAYTKDNWPDRDSPIEAQTIMSLVGEVRRMRQALIAIKGYNTPSPDDNDDPGTPAEYVMLRDQKHMYSVAKAGLGEACDETEEKE